MKKSFAIKSLSIAALVGLAFYTPQVNAQEQDNVIRDHHKESTSENLYGGAIFNDRYQTIDSIDASFEDNSVSTGTDYAGYGGAIANMGTVNGGTIGNIIGNYVESGGDAAGGAIYNMGPFVDAITGEIKNNHAYTSRDYGVGYPVVGGGAIYNKGTLGKITSPEISGNEVKSIANSVSGGAIWNQATTVNSTTTIEELSTSKLSNNRAISAKYDSDNNIVNGSSAYGGAIANSIDLLFGTTFESAINGGTIDEVSDNYIIAYGYARGGAIYNDSVKFKLDKIGNITGNWAYSESAPAYGGAIYNENGTIDEISGLIENNYAQSENAIAYGGAIYNVGGTIGELSGSIKNNYVKGKAPAYGGAIYNAGTIQGGTIDEISGNWAESSVADAMGGAIYNVSSTFKLDKIGNITGNWAYSESAPAYGGAIYTTAGTIDKISGLIENNYAQSEKAMAYGGAIYIVGGTIGELSGSIKNNYVKGKAPAYGGAIYNAGTIQGGTIDEISGNWAESSVNAMGGAIYNVSSTFKLDKIGDITNNHVSGSGGNVQGGAIYSVAGTIDEISGSISNNYVEGKGSVQTAMGGAIFNAGTINKLNSTLTYNHITTAGGQAMGGAIYNAGTIDGGTINNIIGNYIEGAYYISGGAIYNNSENFKLDAITGNITNNYIETQSYGYGGAIYNENGTISNIDVEYIQGNNIRGNGTYRYGGAIYNAGTIENLSAKYLINNYADGNSNVISAQGGAIHNAYNGTINGGTIGEISGNHAGYEHGSEGYGGAIYNDSVNFKLDAINGDIKNNYATSSNSAFGGAIYLGYRGGSIGEIDSDEISGNYVLGGHSNVRGGFLCNQAGTIDSLSTRALINNYAKSGGTEAYGGAIYNYGSDNNGGVDGGTVNGGTIGLISGNYVEGYTQVYGGAIYNSSANFKLDAITGDITNNHAVSSHGARGGAIYNQYGQIGDITGDYILGNYIETGIDHADGGAIYNRGGRIGNIDVKYIMNNHAYSYVMALGGAIYNEGYIESISGSLINNFTTHENDECTNAYGGAIYNSGTVNGGTIGEISGNYTRGLNGYGGAICNYSSSFKLDGITGNIINNYIATNTDAKGGAIYNNNGNLGVISSEIIGYNHAHSGESKYWDNSGGNAFGGAIYNEGAGVIESLNGSLINNYAIGGYKDENGNLLNGAQARGGAIYNTGTVNGGTIGDIIGNYAEAYYPAQGGAIYNSSSKFKLDAIVGNIVNNHAKAGRAQAEGGAIWNGGGTIGKITSEYIANNYAESQNPPAIGGAIYNDYWGTIGEFNTDYLINNHVKSLEYDDNGNIIGGNTAYGGALYNTGTINGGTIGEISGNYAEGYNPAQGGAIYNANSTFKLDGIGDIIGNHATSQRVNALGGAIYNAGGNLGVITGAIEDNYVKTVAAINSGGVTEGGAIYNTGTIEEFNVTTLKNNYASAVTLDDDGNVTGGSNAYGGALANLGTVNGGTIGEISGNYAEGYASGYGGAIYNNSESFKLDAIVGNIVNNHAKAVVAPAQGGAIYTTAGTIDKITSEYIANNYAESQGPPANGGAIYNTGNIKELGADIFENNYVISNNEASGGAIFNGGGNIDVIKGSFVANYAQTDYYTARGGAISNISRIGEINSTNMSNNYAISTGTAGSSFGGAIYNEGLIEKLNIASLKDNYAYTDNNSNVSYGGAIHNVGAVNGGTIGEISGNYAEAMVPSRGGAIYNVSAYFKLDRIGDIVNNHAISQHVYAGGGAIYNENGNLGVISGAIEDNYAKTLVYGPAQGGAIYNTGTIEEVKSKSVKNNYVQNAQTSVSNAPAQGGAFYNTGNIKEFNVKIVNNNYARSGESPAQGGAIYNSGTIDGIVNSSFVNNYTESENGTAQGGAIWTSKDLDISANAGVSVFKGNYTKTNEEKDDNAIFVGAEDVNLNLKQTNNGKMFMYDNIRGVDNFNVNISGDHTGTYYMFNDIYGANVNMANTTVNTVNNEIYTYDFKKLNVNGNTDFVADVDMANQTMDRFTAETYGNHSGKLNVKDMNFISGSDKNKIEIYFAQKGLKDYVTTSKEEYLTPLYKYGIKYDNREDAGYFVFTRGGGSNNPSDGFNPAVLTTPVATQAGAQSTMTNALYYAFEHGDTFMNFSSMDRFAKINSNSYALSTDFNSNTEKIDYTHTNKAVWVKPYSTFETINLKNGPKVNVISYGTLVGFDSNIHKLKRGWANVGTAYIGYNGSQIKHSGVDTTTNGGMLGLTETFYKGNFWTAVTATAGAGVAEAHTMYGKDDMTTLMAGIGSKTGYNFEFNEGKFIIQPRLFMSYSMVKTFDYTNSAGVRINSDPMHTIQINPSIKLIGNIKGWQPYASVGMVWNVLNQTHTEANGVQLPQMHTRPYVEYGVGLQKQWNDKFSAYGQAMVRNGGRNGIALTAGFRVALGKDRLKERVQKENKIFTKTQPNKKSALISKTSNMNNAAKKEKQTNANKKVLKQLSATQKLQINKTTRTTMNAAIKKL